MGKKVVHSLGESPKEMWQNAMAAYYASVKESLDAAAFAVFVGSEHGAFGGINAAADALDEMYAEIVRLLECFDE